MNRQNRRTTTQACASGAGPGIPGTRNARGGAGAGPPSGGHRRGQRPSGQTTCRATDTWPGQNARDARASTRRNESRTRGWGHGSDTKVHIWNRHTHGHTSFAISWMQLSDQSVRLKNGPRDWKMGTVGASRGIVRLRVHDVRNPSTVVVHWNTVLLN